LVGAAFVPFPTAEAVTAKAAENDTVSSFSNSDQGSSDVEDQVEALGFSTELPPRTSPSGEEISNNKNPLGPDVLVLDRTYQLAITYGDNTQADNLHVY
jgi:hypothetical protein